MSKKLLAASLVGAVGIVALAFQLESRPIYSYGLGEFLARDLRDREVRVEGRLVRGSLCRVEEACGYRFVLTDELDQPDAEAPFPESGPTLSVSYDGCTIPDTFGDVPGLDLTIKVQGERCQACHDFEATQIVIRCPPKYERRYDDGLQLPARPPPLCSALEPRM
jgi:cytochrome c-type biogenesis protein CcmE